MKERVHAALDIIYLGCIWTAGIAIAAMTLIIPWGIFTRYVLGSGSRWPEPVAILLMVIFLHSNFKVCQMGSQPNLYKL